MGYFFYTLLSSFYPNTVLFTLFYVVVAKRFSSHWRKNQVLQCALSFSLAAEPGSPNVRFYFYTPLSGFYPSTVFFALFCVVVATRFSSHWRKNQILPNLSYLVNGVVTQSSPHIRDNTVSSDSVSGIKALWKGQEKGQQPDINLPLNSTPTNLPGAACFILFFYSLLFFFYQICRTSTRQETQGQHQRQRQRQGQPQLLRHLPEHLQKTLS